MTFAPSLFLLLHIILLLLLFFLLLILKSDALVRDQVLKRAQGVLAAAGDITGKLGSKLRDGRADARLAKKLVSLVTDAQLGMNLKDFRIGA